MPGVDWTDPNLQFGDQPHPADVAAGGNVFKRMLHGAAQYADKAETAFGQEMVHQFNPIDIVKSIGDLATRGIQHPLDTFNQLTGLPQAAEGVRQIIHDPKSLLNPISPEDVGTTVARGVALPIQAELGGPTAANTVNKTQSLAKRLYRASLKPTGTAAEGARKVDTLLEEGISPIGDKAAWNKIQDYAKQVNARLDNPVLAGETVSPQDVLKDTDPLLKTEAQGGKPGESFNVQVDPADTNAVKSTMQRFIDKHFTPAIPPKSGTLYGPNGQIVGGTPAVPPQEIPIPLKEGQAEKQGTYQMLSKKSFGTGQMAKESVPVASEQTQLAEARGLRRTIAEKAASKGVLDINDISALEGRLLDVMPELQRNAAQFANSGALTLKSAAGANIVRAYGAMGLYKAGKITLPVYTRILKQALPFANQVDDQVQGPTEGGAQ